MGHVSWSDIERQRDAAARQRGRRSRSAERWQREQERRRQVARDLTALMQLRDDVGAIVRAFEANPVGMSGTVVVTTLRMALEKVRAAEQNGQLCEWFAMCANPAVTARAHPVVGPVPICQRCDDKLREIRRE